MLEIPARKVDALSRFLPTQPLEHAALAFIEDVAPEQASRRSRVPRQAAQVGQSEAMVNERPVLRSKDLVRIGKADPVSPKRVLRLDDVVPTELVEASTSIEEVGTQLRERRPAVALDPIAYVKKRRDGGQHLEGKRDRGEFIPGEALRERDHSTKMATARPSVHDRD